MIYNFGEPRDLYPVLYAYTMLFTGYLFALLGVVVVIVFMHQLGKKLSLSVLRPTLFGLFLYITFTTISVLIYNQTH